MEFTKFLEEKMSFPEEKKTVQNNGGELHSKETLSLIVNSN